MHHGTTGRLIAESSERRRGPIARLEDRLAQRLRSRWRSTRLWLLSFLAAPLANRDAAYGFGVPVRDDRAYTRPYTETRTREMEDLLWLWYDVLDERAYSALPVYLNLRGSPGDD